MFWRKNSGNEHYIELARVRCPRVGEDIDLDVCFECTYVRRIEEGGRTPFVRCEPPSKPVG